MKVVVSGDRNWKKIDEVYRILDDLNVELKSKGGITLIIEGGTRGVDTIAREWAKSRKIKHKTFEALWGVYGDAAGPRRNVEMITKGKPDRVIGIHRAIEYSKGTRDCLTKAKAANVLTRLYPKGQSAAWSTF